MGENKLELMAHLMRRAGFGAPREELDARVENGYEETVEELLHPEEYQLADEYLLARYRPSALQPGELYPDGSVWWMYHMVNTERPLEEKMALFWHQVFATSMAKVGNFNELQAQVTMFRHHAMGNFRDKLVEVARNPAMIYFLDQQENHSYAVNENWGRELLELFSMGVGNYTEEDVREASRAFTGWTIAPKLPLYPQQRYLWEYEYKPQEHDTDEKTFLGHTGKFNGEDVIDIIVQQPSCVRFICRHLYSFFVADEPPVPSWTTTPPRDEEAIQYLSKVFREARGDMTIVLRALFNSEFFKNARFTRVKSPAELVAGVLRLVGGWGFPSPAYPEVAMQPTYMGQDLMKPPSVEGWHTGKEWLNSGSVMARVNFASKQVGDLDKPGVQSIVERVKALGTLSPEKLVEQCLDLIGPVEVGEQTHEQLLEHAREGDMLRWESEQESSAAARRVADLLQLIVSSPEYQLN